MVSLGLSNSKNKGAGYLNAGHLIFNKWLWLSWRDVWECGLC